MKTSVIVRFVLAAVIATLGCIGLLADVRLAWVLFLAPMWLLPIQRPKVGQPISRIAMFWLLFGALVAAGIFMGVISSLPRLALPAAPHGVNRLVIVVAMWLLFMWAIYYRWQKAKGKSDA